VTTTPKLLPCPFCGGEARLYRKPWSGHGEGGEYSVVACKSCPADVQAQDYTPDDARAIELWNARPAPLPASEAPVAWRAYGPGRWANSWQDGKPTADDLEYSRTRGYAITYAYARAESAAPASVPEGVRPDVDAYVSEDTGTVYIDFTNDGSAVSLLLKKDGEIIVVSNIAGHRTTARGTITPQQHAALRTWLSSQQPTEVGK
jgi:Lar family restriction alleviation protein